MQRRPVAFGGPRSKRANRGGYRSGFHSCKTTARNRREACRRAGVRPNFTDVLGVNGTDPLSYIISANVHRRHMTRAQRAMALAMMAPEADDKGGRGKPSKILEGFEGSDRKAMGQAIFKARFVLKHKPLLAPEVLSGIIPLDAAYKQALAIDAA